MNCLRFVFLWSPPSTSGLSTFESRDYHFNLLECIYKVNSIFNVRTGNLCSWQTMFWLLIVIIQQQNIIENQFSLEQVRLMQTVILEAGLKWTLVFVQVFHSVSKMPFLFPVWPCAFVFLQGWLGSGAAMLAVHSRQTQMLLILFHGHKDYRLILRYWCSKGLIVQIQVHLK